MRIGAIGCGKLRILALDIAATTGWAFSDEKTKRSGIKSFGLPLGEFADNFEAWLLAVIAEYQPDMIAVEAPVPVRGKTRLDIQMRAYGAHAIVHKTCRRKGIRLENVDVGKWRKEFIGRARAPALLDGKKPKAHQRRAWLKKAAVSECERRGWPVSSDDEADAVGVLSFASHLIATKMAA